jgi:hypothetical protein
VEELVGLEVELELAVDGLLGPLPRGVDLGQDLRRRTGRKIEVAVVGAGHQEADLFRK